MVDPQEALEILEKYYATVTPEQFKEDVRRAAPQGESLHEEWGWITQEKAEPPTAVGAKASVSRRRMIADEFFRTLVLILNDKKDVMQVDTTNPWLASLLSLFTRLTSYFSYWGERDREGIQMVAESFLDTYLSSFPEKWWDKAKVAAPHSSHIVIHIEDGKAIWEGIYESAYFVTPDRPVQPWELVMFSEVLKQLDETDYEPVSILPQAAVVIQSRLWMARLCDDNIRRSVWRLLYDGPAQREVTLHIPDDWISRDEIPRIFSPWITWQDLGDDPTSALASLLPLGAVVTGVKEIRLLVTRNREVPDPDLVIKMLTPLLDYCPWSGKLRSYLKPCLGSLVSRQGELRMKEAAKQALGARQFEEATKLQWACVACYRILVDPVDKADLTIKDLLDVSRTAVMLRNLGNHWQAVPYVERFVNEWNTQGLENLTKPRPGISEKDWWGAAAGAFRIHGLQLLRVGQQNEAISALRKALKYYDNALQPFWAARAAYDLYKATQQPEYLSEASIFAEKATSARPALLGGWRLRISLLLETAAGVDTVETLYSEAYHKIDPGWREQLQFNYGALLGGQFPWEAAEHWLELIQSGLVTEDKSLSIADQLVELVKQEPNLWDEVLLPMLSDPLDDTSSLSELWIWAHNDPARVPASAFQNFLCRVDQYSETRLETLAEFCADRATEEPMGSEEREIWRLLSCSFNLPLQERYPIENWNGRKSYKVVWTRAVRLELLGNAVDKAANILDLVTGEVKKDPYIRFYRAEVAYRQSDYPVAIQLLEDLVDEGGTAPRVDQLDRLYRVCMRLEDRQRAEGVLNRMLKVRPADARALVALGHFKYGAEDLTAAAECYTQAIQSYIDQVDENGSWAGSSQQQAFNMTIRSLISVVRETTGSISQDAKDLIESGGPEVVEAFAEQLRLLGEFDSRWCEVLRSAVRQVPTRRAGRAIAQYFMGRAIALALGLYKDGTFEAWVDAVHQEFNGDVDLLSEFIGGAKETYLKRLSQLVERLASGAVDKDAEKVLDWLLADWTRDCPDAWQDLLDFVITTKGSRTYYRDVREQVSHLRYTDKHEFHEFIKTEISAVVRHEARPLRESLKQLRDKTSSKSQIAAINIAEQLPTVHSLWLPARMFGSDARPHNGNGHTPLWLAKVPFHIASIGILGPEVAREARPDWNALPDGSYSCAFGGDWGALKQEVRGAAQKLLAKQNIWMSPESGGLQIVLPPSASALDIMV